MKVPLSWLKEFVDIHLPPEDLAHLLTMAGLEVSAVTVIGLEGAELPWDPAKIMVANIREVRPHPNADMLVLADVDYGAPDLHTVVTGAPNVFAYRGQGPLAHPLKSVFALEGAQLYDGHKEGRVVTTLKGRPVRGVMSDAMLCSEKELGISDEHEGILFLEDEAPVGTPLRDLLGDVVLTIDITPNVARALSIVGVAREVAALTGQALRLPDPQVEQAGPPIAGRAQVTVEDERLCPRFTLGLVEGIQVGTSPQWMQRRLRAAGMRPVNTIVDISNYVMLEWGQPTHAFDANRVQDMHLIARLSRPGEQLTTLDDKERDLTPFSGTSVPGPLLVCDPAGPLGIAGVMGGAASEVSATTTRVLFEAATWEPVQVRRTAQTFKLPSEASHRFERGVDIALPPLAQRRGLELMRTLAGGTVAQGVIDVYPTPYQPPLLELAPGEVARLLGVQLSAYQLAEMLQALGFPCQVRGVSGIGDLAGLVGTVMDPMTVLVSVPSFRQDVTSVADLCEEVARMYGYDNIPATQLADELPRADPHPELEREQAVRDTLAGCGLDEIITYSLTSMEAVAQVSPAAADPAAYLRLSNPITPEREYMRRSLLPTMLDALAQSLRERERVLFYEIGRIFLPRPAPTSAEASGQAWLPDEPRFLGIAIAGPRTRLGWHEATTTPLDIFDLKGIIEVVLERLGISARVAFVPVSDDERLHPGRAARLVVAPAQPGAEAGAVLGVLGELHPDVRERFEIKAQRSAVAEIDLDALMGLVQPRHYSSISRYPAIVQDLAVVAATDIPAAQVAAIIRRSAGEALESLTLFDIFSGEQLGAEKRSLTYRMVFRAADRTLSDEALARVRRKIVSTLEREINATIRG